MASRIIDVDYYAGGDRKVVTSVDTPAKTFFNLIATHRYLSFENG